MSINPLLSASLRPGRGQSIPHSVAPGYSGSNPVREPDPRQPRLGASPAPSSSSLLLPGGRLIYQPNINSMHAPRAFSKGAGSSQSASSNESGHDKSCRKPSFGAMLQVAIAKSVSKSDRSIASSNGVQFFSSGTVSPEREDQAPFEIARVSIAANQTSKAATKQKTQQVPLKPTAGVGNLNAPLDRASMVLSTAAPAYESRAKKGPHDWESPARGDSLIRDPLSALDSHAIPKSEGAVVPLMWSCNKLPPGSIHFEESKIVSFSTLPPSLQLAPRDQGANFDCSNRIEPQVSQTINLSSPPVRSRRVDARPAMRQGEVSDNFVRLNLKRKRGASRLKRKVRVARDDSEDCASEASTIEEGIPPEGTNIVSDQHDSITCRPSSGRLVDPLQLCLIELDEVEAKRATIPSRSSSATHRAIEILQSANTPLFKRTETMVVCNEVIADTNCDKTSDLKKTPLIINKRKRKTESASGVGGSLVSDEWLEQLAPKCSGHSMPAKLLRVKKAGPNKGRRFYGCTFPQDQRCKFFMWAEDNPDLVGVVVKANKSRAAIVSGAMPTEQPSADEEWRRFAIEKYCDKLQTLDILSLKLEIRARRRSHRFWAYHRAKTFNLSGNKSELIKKLVEEAFAFLQSDDILYGDSNLVARYDESDSPVAARDDLIGASESEAKDTGNSSSSESGEDTNIEPFPSHRLKSASEVNQISRENYKSYKNTAVLLNGNNSATDSDDANSDILILSDSDSCTSESVDSASPDNNHNTNYYDNDRETDRNRVKSTERRAGATSSCTHMSVDRVRQLCFSFDEFKPGQRWAIDRVLSGKNSLLVVPTGSGKSLTFFLPALILGGGARAVLPGGDPGLTIVVSPLISIMNDQLMRLPVHLPGAIFSSGLTAVENANLTSAILNGFLRILFVSPERLCTASFRNLMRLLRRKRQETRATNAQRPVALLCVDEAHCLSQWSFNFRPSFLRIKREIAHIAPRAVLALTATASAAVQRDIMDHLGIPSDGLCTHPPARYNLKLSAAKTSDDTISRNEAVLKYLVENLSTGSQSSTQTRMHMLSETSKKRLGASIVYVWRRHDAEVLAEFLRSAGLNAASYHAGMDSQQRLKTQTLFMRGSIDVVVATIAFGMGLDKSNVRCVIHTTTPKSVENYIQEIGRAGRDGNVSNCFLVMDKSDTISQYSLSFASRVSTYQIYLFLTVVFESVYKELILLANESDVGISNATSNEDVTSSRVRSVLAAWSSASAAPLRAALSPALIRSRTDLSDSVIDTLIAILELSPFMFLEVDGTRLDTINGKYRDIIAPGLAKSSRDALENAIVSLNKLPKSSIADPNAVSSYLSGSIFDVGHALRASFYSDMSYESYGFRVSLMELSNHLKMDSDQVSCALFAKQKQGILSYTASDPMLYCTLSLGRFSHSFGTFLNSAPGATPDTVYRAWLHDLASSVSSVVAKATDDTAARVLDMWRVGSVIANASLTTRGENPSDSLCSSEIRYDPRSTDSIMDFLCLYMDNLSDSQRSNYMTSDGDVLCLLESYWNTELPISDLEKDANGAIESQIRSDVIAVLANPGLRHILGALENASGLASHAASADDRVDFLSIYAARVLHGLPTDRLAAFDWTSAGDASSRWASRRDIRFDAIIKVARGYLSTGNVD